MAKVKKETAIKELGLWLSSKGFDEDEQKEQEAGIEMLAEFFVKGYLSINTQGNIEQKLRVPIKEIESGAVIADTLIHLNNVWVKDIQNEYQKHKDLNIDLKVLCALKASVKSCKVGDLQKDFNSKMLERLFTKDYQVASAIAGFLAV